MRSSCIPFRNLFLTAYNRRSVVLLLVLFSALLPFAQATLSQQPQTVDVNTSTGAPGTIYHGASIDDVNLSSGNLRIAIPLLHLPGRGIDTNIVLTYNSKIWETTTKLIPDGNNTIEHIAAVSANANRAAGAGWHAGFPRALGSAHGKAWTYCVTPVNGGCASSYSYTSQVASDGTVMTFVADTTNSNTYFHTFDGTYARKSPSALIYKDGVRVPFSTGGTIEDTNGNFISASSSVNGITYTDTIGRTITYSQPQGGNTQTISYKDSSGATQTISFTYQSFTLSFPFVLDQWGACPGTPDCGISANETDQLLTKVTLPNGLSYQFQYATNPDGTTTGEINKVLLPTGGYIRYQYGFTVDLDCPDPQAGQNRTVTSRIVSSDGTAASEKTWTYVVQNASANWTGAAPVSTLADPLGNIQAQTQAPGVPIPNKVEYKNASGTDIKTINQTIAYDSSAFNDPVGPNVSNPRVTSRTTILNDTNQQSKEVLTYGSAGNVTRKDEYDFALGAPGALVRYTTFTHLHDSNSAYAGTSVNILDRITSKTVCNAAGTVCGQTNTTYDGATPTATSSVVQHDYSGFPASYNLRANPTQVSRKVNTTGAWLTTTNTFNDVGNLLQTTDPANHTTSFSYSDNYYNLALANPTSAFVTQTTRPATGATNHITRKQYYFNSGLPSSDCGENFPIASNCAFGLSSQADYTTYTYDLMHRSKTIVKPDGGQTTITYNEALPLSTVSSSLINPTTQLTRTSIYDGLGRVSQAQVNSDPQGAILVDTTYDALGRISTVSNPHRAGSDPTTTQGTTTYYYDALSRKCLEVPPDGTQPTGGVCPATQPTNTVFATYSGNTIIVTDQTGKSRKSTTDGLGRMTQVFEDPVGLNYETDYAYDALGNLLCVGQKGTNSGTFTNCSSIPSGWHPRTFTYDLLSRLLTSSNPETGTITYKYDSDTNCASPNSFPGLLVSKVDARGIRTCAQYDALNRGTVLNYSNGDPTITTTYDQSNCLGLSACQNIGQRTSRTDAAGSEAWAYLVDPTNNRSVHVNQRTTSGITKTSTYYLDLAGNVTQAVYPTGRAVNYTYDAANRPKTAADGANGITYATDFQTVPTGCLTGAVCYTPQGTFYTLSIGQTSSFAGLNLTHTYNNRLQPLEFKASSSGGNAMDITYSFLDASGHNAGHVYGIANNLDTTRSQTFAYDQLNRITSALTTSTHASSPAHCWGESYTVDAWGNLNSIAGTTNSNYTGCTQESGFSSTADGNNHLPAWAYDASGNATSDGVVTNYAWDAESQLKSAAGVSYLYDGDGRRVSKSNGKLYWYGSGGDILAETNSSGSVTAEYIFFGGKRIAMIPAGGNPTYYLEDLLGTSRVLATNTGGVCYDADFYPYGGERSYTNTCPQSYKFEGKERDTETGNDDFGARYYSNRFGRWLSADWSSVPVAVPYANLTNPQTLNLYSMVSDDPESFADLDGHLSTFLDSSGEAAGSKVGSDPNVSSCGEGNNNSSSCTEEQDKNHPAAQAQETNSVVQLAKDEAIGIAKEAANTVIGITNLVDNGINAVLGTNLQTPEFKPTTPGEKSAMLGTSVALLLVPGGGEAKVLSKGEKITQLTAEAEKLYPKLAGKADQLHHVTPQYLGGAKNGPVSRISAAYHQSITNAFRELAPYGKKFEGSVQKLLDNVYSRFPLP